MVELAATLFVAMVGASCLGWIIVSIVHWFDHRQAERIREARTKSRKAIMDEGKANILHGWD
jgi:hypothetical protein